MRYGFLKFLSGQGHRVVGRDLTFATLSEVVNAKLNSSAVLNLTGATHTSTTNGKSQRYFDDALFLISLSDFDQLPVVLKAGLAASDFRHRILFSIEKS